MRVGCYMAAEARLACFISSPNHQPSTVLARCLITRKRRLRSLTSCKLTPSPMRRGRWSSRSRSRCRAVAQAHAGVCIRRRFFYCSQSRSAASSGGLSVKMVNNCGRTFSSEKDLVFVARY